MFRCSIAAANTDKLQFKFKFYSCVMWTVEFIVWMIKMITKKGGPHLNICLGAPESLVTPLNTASYTGISIHHAANVLCQYVVNIRIQNNVDSIFHKVRRLLRCNVLC